MRARGSVCLFYHDQGDAKYETKRAQPSTLGGVTTHKDSQEPASEEWCCALGRGSLLSSHASKAGGHIKLGGHLAKTGSGCGPSKALHGRPHPADSACMTDAAMAREARHAVVAQAGAKEQNSLIPQGPNRLPHAYVLLDKHLPSQG